MIELDKDILAHIDQYAECGRCGWKGTADDLVEWYTRGVSDQDADRCPECYRRIRLDTDLKVV